MQASTQQYMAVLDVDIDRWVKTVVLMHLSYFSDVEQDWIPTRLKLSAESNENKTKKS